LPQSASDPVGQPQGNYSYAAEYVTWNAGLGSSVVDVTVPPVPSTAVALYGASNLAAQPVIQLYGTAGPFAKISNTTGNFLALMDVVTSGMWMYCGLM
jgi:hypothetical protein